MPADSRSRVLRLLMFEQLAIYSKETKSCVSRQSYHTDASLLLFTHVSMRRFQQFTPYTACVLYTVMCEAPRPVIFVFYLDILWPSVQGPLH